jgi:hypothetical protein
MLTFFTVVAIRLMLRRRWWWAGAAAGLAGFVYPIGFVLVPVMLLWVLLVRRDVPLGKRLLFALAEGALAFTGTFVVFVIQQIQVGSWHASLTMQERLGTTLLDPLRSLVRIVIHQNTLVQNYPGNATTISEPIAHQTLLVALLITAITVGVIVTWLQAHHLDRDELALLVLFVGIWIVPLASFIDTGIYRREATLLPVAMLLNRLPTPVVLAFAAACVYVAAQISPHFFDYRLI